VRRDPVHARSGGNNDFVITSPTAIAWPDSSVADLRARVPRRRPGCHWAAPPRTQERWGLGPAQGTRPSLEPEIHESILHRVCRDSELDCERSCRWSGSKLSGQFAMQIPNGPLRHQQTGGEIDWERDRVVCRPASPSRPENLASIALSIHSADRRPPGRRRRRNGGAPWRRDKHMFDHVRRLGQKSSHGAPPTLGRSCASVRALFCPTSARSAQRRAQVACFAAIGI